MMHGTLYHAGVGNDDYRTRKQTARILKVSEQTVDRYARQGLIETVKCGPRRILIPTTEIQKLLAKKVGEE
jgi:excisionase family DNA binding protein